MPKAKQEELAPTTAVSQTATSVHAMGSTPAVSGVTYSFCYVGDTHATDSGGQAAKSTAPSAPAYSPSVPLPEDLKIELEEPRPYARSDELMLAMHIAFASDTHAWLQEARTEWRAFRKHRRKARKRAKKEHSRAKKRARKEMLQQQSQQQSEQMASQPLPPPPAQTQQGQKLHGAAKQSSITLKHLVDYGVLEAGPHKVFIVYSQSNAEHTWSASLRNDGIIEWSGEEFATPSAFAMYVKRLVNPMKKADDGWKTVKYGNFSGPTLEAYKRHYESNIKRHNVGLQIRPLPPELAQWHTQDHRDRWNLP